MTKEFGHMNKAVRETQRILLSEAASPQGAQQLVNVGSRIGADQYLPLYRLWEKYVPRGARVLDWGCGYGHFSLFLTQAGHRVAGFDFKDFPLRARLGDSYEWRQGNEAQPRELPFGDAEFDAVSSIGVLEHVRETGGTESASLAEIFRVLKPGGVFVCFHFPNTWSCIDFLASRVPGKHHHIYRYSQSDIGALCAEAGLELLEMRRYGVMPRNSGTRLPRHLRGSRRIAALWNALDNGLRLPLQGIAQNHLWVARKPVVP